MVLQGMAWQQVVALLGTIRAPLWLLFLPFMAQVPTFTFAEARAPLFGLMLCYRLGYSKVAVESEKKSFLIASVEVQSLGQSLI